MRTAKAPRRQFLRHNPFPRPFTEGFFFREKMRAIHRVTPNASVSRVLEIGGGRGGVTALLFPGAQVVNVDIDRRYAHDAPNRQETVRFVCADAAALPFERGGFDAVTMFDVLEHVPDDRAAVQQALSVLRPGGWLLLSSPNERWRFPYYRVMRRWCPTDAEIMRQWGHARRGYTVDELEGLLGVPCRASATFISPLSVLCHDAAFSRLAPSRRRYACLALAPLAWIGYAVHRPSSPGTETASAWQPCLSTDRKSRSSCQ
ncbi:MAG: class I SAM-dependent methyltransferase [Acidimicrobiia bacterium]